MFLPNCLQAGNGLYSKLGKPCDYHNRRKKSSIYFQKWMMEENLKASQRTSFSFSILFHGWVTKNLIYNLISGQGYLKKIMNKEIEWLFDFPCFHFLSFYFPTTYCRQNFVSQNLTSQNRLRKIEKSFYLFMTTLDWLCSANLNGVSWNWEDHDQQHHWHISQTDRGQSEWASTKWD